MAEKEIAKKVSARVAELKGLGEPIEAVKISGSRYQRSSEPDFSCTYWGWSVKAELKDVGEKARKDQTARLADYRAAGAVVGVVETIQQFDLLLLEARMRASKGVAFLANIHYQSHKDPFDISA